jgi:phosphohistidine phosphatase SixA
LQNRLRRSASAAMMLAALLLLPTWILAAPTPDVGALIERLKQGGYVLLMRHAEAPYMRPRAAQAAPGNGGRERQLDARGRQDAVQFGNALRALGIPLQPVWVSPLFRTRETLQWAGITPDAVKPELIESEHGNAGVAQQQAQWLRAAVLAVRPGNANALFMSHQSKLRLAFGAEVAAYTGGRRDWPEYGDMLVFRAGQPRFVVEGIIPMAAWAKYATAAALP